MHEKSEFGCHLRRMDFVGVCLFSNLCVFCFLTGVVRSMGISGNFVHDACLFRGFDMLLVVL